MVKTDWELREGEAGTVLLTRYRTPMWLWLLDRWFRIPDMISDRVEWWFPRTSRITRVPCLLYSWWLPKVIARRDLTEYDVEARPEPDDDEEEDEATAAGTTT